jgi:putative transposase
MSEMIFVGLAGEWSVVESGSPSYRGHRYPVEIISHAVWLYFRFPLSFREVEELMLQRGVIVVSSSPTRRSAAGA